MLFHLDEWQSTGTKIWYCEHTSSHPKNVDKWVLPARLLGISADEFLKWLINNYQPDHIFHNEDCSFVGWGWSSQAKMRLYKNYINKVAREKNFLI